MNCLDCEAPVEVAAAVCARCGAGLCRDHLVAGEEPLTVVMPVNVPVAVSPLDSGSGAPCAA